MVTFHEMSNGCNTTICHLFVLPPPPAIISNEFIRPDDPRLPRLEALMDGNPPPPFVVPPEHFCWLPPFPPLPYSGVPVAEECGGGASSFLRICSSKRACMSIYNGFDNLSNATTTGKTILKMYLAINRK